MFKENAILEEKNKNLPGKPGVYLFKNKEDKVIYVGKAKVLKNRVRSYFQATRTRDAKTVALVSKIHDLELFITDSEVEALILEANLVKKYKPRYNINLKDDKSFPYIKITNEPYPRVYVTRNRIPDGGKYFGPYTDVKTMRRVLKVMESVFPIRTCRYKIDDEVIKKGSVKLCLEYHIHKCPGPCEGLINEEDYGRMISQVKDFLNGKTENLISDLHRQMEKYSTELKFEHAARIRDHIRDVNNYTERQKVVVQDVIDRDIFAVSADEDDACGVVFKVREGKITGRQHFYLNGVEHKSDAEVIRTLARDYYLKSDFLPDEVYLQESIEDIETVEEWLSEKQNRRVKLIVPKIGEKRKLVEMCMRNAGLLLDELKLQKMQKKDFIPHALRALQRDLHLSKPPRRIESFDNSNLQGTDAVASMVTFVDAKPRKNDYRRFKIKTVEGADDFASMEEIITRRYTRVLKEKTELPDLILIDGGKGQLSSALKVLKSLKLDKQPIAALAKRLEEVYLPGISDPQNIPKTSSGLRLLRIIRDETHRFAIEYHRKLRRKRTLHSELEEIEGIGEHRRDTLIKYFGSLKKIREATADDLANAPGISRELAKKIYMHFNS